MNYFWQTIQNNHGYTSLELKRIQYTLKVFGSELSKIAMIFIIFYCFGKTEEYMIALLVLCSLRMYSGGAHMNHYWSCFLCSAAVLALSACILPLLPLPAYLRPVITGICCLVTWRIGPIPSTHRPKITYEAWKNFRFKSVVVLLFYTGITIIFYRFRYLDIVVWTIVVQTLQLIITNILQKGERYEKFTEQNMGKESM